MKAILDKSLNKQKQQTNAINREFKLCVLLATKPYYNVIQIASMYLK